MPRVSDTGKVIRNDCNICHTVLSDSGRPVTMPKTIDFQHPVDLGGLADRNAKAATRRTNLSGIRLIWEISRCSSALSVIQNSSHKKAQKAQMAKVILGIAIGMAVGVGAYTFVYARGYSYMSDNAEACVNCHIMQEQFSGWLKSSHRAVAVCNDCHTPPGLVGKYATKAQNGFWHSYYFTTGWYPDNIHITPGGRAVAEQACRKCHEDIVQAIEGPHGDAQTSCLRCHSSVGHLH